MRLFAWCNKGSIACPTINEIGASGPTIICGTLPNIRYINGEMPSEYNPDVTGTCAKLVAYDNDNGSWKNTKLNPPIKSPTKTQQSTGQSTISMGYSMEGSLTTASFRRYGYLQAYTRLGR